MIDARRALADVLRFAEDPNLIGATTYSGYFMRRDAAIKQALDVLRTPEGAERQAVQNVGENTSRTQNIQEDVGAPNPSGVTP